MKKDSNSTCPLTRNCSVVEISIQSVGPVRLELTALRLKAGYSCQLSYEPIQHIVGYQRVLVSDTIPGYHLTKNSAGCFTAEYPVIPGFSSFFFPFRKAITCCISNMMLRNFMVTPCIFPGRGDTLPGYQIKKARTLMTGPFI